MCELNDPCENDGVCIVGDDGAAECVCTKNYEGEFCADRKGKDSVETPNLIAKAVNLICFFF